MYGRSEVREIEGTFLFADLAGYTAATWTHGDDLAARLAIRLVDLARSSCKQGDEVVKSIGDAVMCRSASPDDGLGLLRRIWGLADVEPHFPHLRAAIHHGSAVEHEGDYFGTTVNVAARIAALAAPDEILATGEVGQAAARLGWNCESTGMRALRNIGTEIEVFRIQPAERETLPVDPVCHMRVDVATAITATWGGQQSFFCSQACADEFIAATR